MEKIKTIGDNPKGPHPMPGFEPSGLLIGLIAGLALALVIGLGLVLRKNRGSA
jgi:hypothetical protein